MKALKTLLLATIAAMTAKASAQDIPGGTPPFVRITSNAIWRDYKIKLAPVMESYRNQAAAARLLNGLVFLKTIERITGFSFDRKMMIQTLQERVSKTAIGDLVRYLDAEAAAGNP